jgi:hypothetical protein
MKINDHTQENLPCPQEGGLVDNVPLGIQDIQALTDRIGDITTKLCDSVTTWKQMDYQMHQMDIQFNLFMAKVDYDLTKYTNRLPIVEKQLDFVNSQMEKILNHALAMGTETEIEIDLKMKLLDQSEKYLDKLSSMMMQLM